MPSKSPPLPYLSVILSVAGLALEGRRLEVVHDIELRMALPLWGTMDDNNLERALSFYAGFVKGDLRTFLINYPVEYLSLSNTKEFSIPDLKWVGRKPQPVFQQHISFLCDPPEAVTKISLTTDKIMRDENREIESGLERLKVYCEDNGKKIDMALVHSLEATPVEFLSNLFQTVSPNIPCASVLTLEFITCTSREPTSIDLNLPSTKALRVIADLLEQHNVSLHLIITEKGSNTTAEIFFKTTFCTVVCEKLAAFVKVLKFRDKGTFQKDGAVAYKDNEEAKVQELHQFFRPLPHQFPRLEKVECSFPIYAHINDHLEEMDNGGCKLYHLTTMTVIDNKRQFIDKRLRTGGTTDTRLRGEEEHYEEKVLVITE